MQISELAASDHVAVVITDPRLADNPIIECNSRFLELTGFDRSEVIGRNCRFLAGPGTDPDRTRMISDAIRERRPVLVELLNYRKDGTPFLNSVMIAPLYDGANILTGFIGSQVEISHEEVTSIGKREENARRLITSLTPRQREVLAHISRGNRAKQIAHELGLSERTIKMHRSAMLKALNVRTNAEAIRIAVRANL